VGCGSSHTVALVAQGESRRLFAFGQGEDGQLGLGDAEPRLLPAEVLQLSDERPESVVCGAEHTVAFSTDRARMWSWGWGDFGRLGHGDYVDVFLPKSVAAFEGVRVKQVACGDSHSAAVLADGRLQTWGRNQNGQLGLGNTADSVLPETVTALEGIVVSSVACGAEHTIAATGSGDLYSWGWNSYAPLGLGHMDDVSVPTKVGGLPGPVVRVACGWRNSAAVCEGGVLLTFGWSKYGQCGHGDNETQLRPRRVDFFASKPVSEISGGWRHMVATTASGELYAWGWNSFGQLGIGSHDDSNHPMHVAMPACAEGQEPTQVVCGWRHTAAVFSGGAVYTWGRAVAGQLGHGDTEERARPVRVAALDALPTLDESRAAAASDTAVTYISPVERYSLVPEHSNAQEPPDNDDANRPVSKRPRVEFGL